ncbi:Eukaryotic translation initiation factor 4 gamma 1 [Dionaea muscipula]
MERDLLAKLLVNLAKPGDGSMFTAAQLIEGFESVLANLEDSVIDAPKAAEFLGQLFGKIIAEKIVPLGEVERSLGDYEK